MSSCHLPVHSSFDARSIYTKPTSARNLDSVFLVQSNSHYIILQPRSADLQLTFFPARDKNLVLKY